MPLDAIQSAAAAQFDRQSANYGTGHILAQTADLEAALPHLALPAQPRVLDVATGGGHCGLFFAARGAQVILGDIATKMLAAAAKLAAERGLVVETREFPAEVIPFADATFDLVTSRVAPHHFSAPDQFVREVARVLKPGGFFLLIDGSIEDGQPEAEAWIHQLEKWRDPSHHRFWTPGAWQCWCEASGLTVTRSRLEPFKQPDLEWYFRAASTSPENQALVRAAIAAAPATVRQFFRLGEEGGKTVWWWQRLTLVARKAPA